MGTIYTSSLVPSPTIEGRRSGIELYIKDKWVTIPYTQVVELAMALLFAKHDREGLTKEDLQEIENNLDMFKSALKNKATV